MPADSEDASLVGYEVTSRSLARYVELRDDESVALSGQRPAASQFVWGDVDPAALELEVEVQPAAAVGIDYYRVFTGAFDADAARDALASASERRAGSHEGYDLYAGVSPSDGDGTGAYGVGDGVVVQVGGAFQSTGTPEQVQRVVDAGTGASARLTDQDDAVREVTSRIGSEFVAGVERQDPDQETDVETSSFAGVEAVGYGSRVEGGTFRIHEVYAFGTADAVEAGEFEAYVSHQESDGRLDSASFGVDGRVVTVDSEGPLDALV